ncbi:hypothetical protein D3C78_351650 [compost metagenome]
MATVTLFKHRRPTMRIVGQSLKVYQFTQNRYFTQIPEEEAELKKMVGQCGIYIDPKEPTIDTEAADPVSIMQKNMRAQLLAELRGQGVVLPDSFADEGKIKTGMVNTSSSTLMDNAGAERKEEERIQQRADEIIHASQVPDVAPKSEQLSPLQMMEKLKSQGSQTS